MLQVCYEVKYSHPFATSNGILQGHITFRKFILLLDLWIGWEPHGRIVNRS